MKSLRILIYLLITLISFSCLDEAPTDFDNPESTWNPNFSLPVGYTSLQMNEESGFDVSLLEDLDNSGFPDWVDEIDLAMSYTMPFDLQEMSDFSDEIVSVMFRLNTYNGFPNQATGQIYFLDFAYQKVDSLFINGPLTMQAGTIQGDGETISTTHDQNDVVFSQDKIDDLTTVRHILIEGAILKVSLDSTLIDYYPNYSLELQLGVQAELNMSLSKN